MKKLVGVVFFSFVSLSNAFASHRETFNEVLIGSLWVDACIVEYGDVNCSDYAKRDAANAFCRKKGYDESVGTFYTRDEGPHHTTYRLTYFRRNGVDASEWRGCNGCGNRISKVTCISH